MGNRKAPAVLHRDRQPVRHFREPLENLPWQVRLTFPGVTFHLYSISFGNRSGIPASGGLRQSFFAGGAKGRLTEMISPTWNSILSSAAVVIS